jgi:hypothetical protein
VEFVGGYVAAVLPHRLEHLLVEASATRTSGVAVPLSEVAAAGCCHSVGNP